MEELQARYREQGSVLGDGGVRGPCQRPPRLSRIMRSRFDFPRACSGATFSTRGEWLWPASLEAAVVGALQSCAPSTECVSKQGRGAQ